MRAPSARMLANRVTVSKWASWARDAAGSRTATYGTPSAPVACSVQPSSSRDVPDHLREAAVNYHTAYFAADPGVRIRDRLDWGGRTLVVTASNDLAGRGRVFSVVCEERPET